MAALLCLLLLLATPVAWAQPSCISRDRDALLEFKAGLNDPFNSRLLDTWNKSGDCCQFASVTCNAKGEVTNLTLRAVYSEECEDTCPILQVKPGVKNLIGRALSKLAALEVLDLRVIRFRGDAYPVGLGALRKLRVLTLVGLELQGDLPPDLGLLTSLTSLVVSNLEAGAFTNTVLSTRFSVTGTFPTFVCNLTKLEVLNLRQELRDPGQLSGPIPACLGNLRQLRVLGLESNRFSGPLPPSLASLTKLQVLKLTNNFFTGSIPAYIGSLPLLEVLYLDGNNFTGSIPTSIVNLSRLKDLRIGGYAGINDFGVFVFERTSQLSGTLPTQLGRLANLQTLIVRAALLSGPIPPSIGQLVLLSDLQLDKNRLSGSIPASLSNTNISNLVLSNNRLTGPIPPSLARLRYSNLLLARNELSGPIPRNLAVTGEGRSNGVLDLSFNRLTGAADPPSLFRAVVVRLNNNLLTSFYPQEENLFLLQPPVRYFDIHSNRFTGTVPQWIVQLSLTDNVDISDNRFTEFTPTPGDPEPGVNFVYFNISFNAFSGQLPAYLFRFNFVLTVMDASNNRLTALPSFNNDIFQRLSILNFANNQLTGTIPESLFGSSLEVLILKKNLLTGPIPNVAASGVLLKVLDLSDNQLEGPVPAMLFTPEQVLSLEKVSLGNNKLSGGIPDFTVNCKSLQTLVLEKNQLTGPVFPNGAVLKNCDVLAVYDVSNNKLGGSIPSSVGRLEALRVLDVSNNSVGGKLQSNLQNLHKLQALVLSSNKIGGQVPFSKLTSGLQALRVARAASNYTPGAPVYEDTTSFQSQDDHFTTVVKYQLLATGAINFASNFLEGNIDASIGNLKGVHLLDLSDNKFSGRLPSSLADITDLQDFDVSNNNLQGPIPPQLSDFPPEDFAGNPLLCGRPLTTVCP